jgi:hypothetical protein
VETFKGPVQDSNEPVTEETGDARPRPLLPSSVLIGAGAAGLTLLSEQSAHAAAPAEDLRYTYDGVQNLFRIQLRISAQNGNTFSGSFDDGTPIAGTVTGARSDGDITTPITIVFNRILGDGTVQTHVGAAAVGLPGRGASLAGVFYHNGLGPYPWWAEATIIT